MLFWRLVGATFCERIAPYLKQGTARGVMGRNSAYFFLSYVRTSTAYLVLLARVSSDLVHVLEKGAEASCYGQGFL
jgi:hypothetical protein